jgi:ankyrin repeat protein
MEVPLNIMKLSRSILLGMIFFVSAAIAFSHKNFDLLSLILNDSDETEITGTPLIEASKTGHIDVVKDLIAKGADINEKTEEGWTALIAASHFGHLDGAVSRFRSLEGKCLRI